MIRLSGKLLAHNTPALGGLQSLLLIEPEVINFSAAAPPCTLTPVQRCAWRRPSSRPTADVSSFVLRKLAAVLALTLKGHTWAAMRLMSATTSLPSGLCSRVIVEFSQYDTHAEGSHLGSNALGVGHHLVIGRVRQQHGRQPRRQQRLCSFCFLPLTCSNR